jgi:hypothetical protein
MFSLYFADNGSKLWLGGYPLDFMLSMSGKGKTEKTKSIIKLKT